jgi:hypothetical protein
LAFDQPEKESESGVGVGVESAFTRPSLTRKASVRVKRQAPGALDDDDEDDEDDDDEEQQQRRRPDAPRAVPEPRPVASVANPDSWRRHYHGHCRKSVHVTDASEKDRTHRPRPPQREKAARTVAWSPVGRTAKRLTLGPPSLLERRMLLLLLRGTPLHQSTGNPVGLPRLQAAV